MANHAVNETRREFLKMSGHALSGVVMAGSIVAALPEQLSAQSTSVKEPAVIGTPTGKV